MKHFLRFLIAFVAIAAISCDSSDEDPTFDSGKEYFPLKKGNFQIYDVVSVEYTLGVPETLRYELKILTTDSFPNSEGTYTYVLYRSKRNEGAAEFSYLDSWSARMDSRDVVMNEENTAFLKIKLPVSKGDEWDGNLYNAQGEDTYTMEEVGAAFASNGQTYDDCIVINQNDNQDFVVTLDQRKEVYARHVGLIYKEVRLLNYCTVGSCLGQQQVESGVIFTQTIKSYGVE
ncbi:MAG TPA: hypothetical protein VFZ52_03005 [Chryseolinea sp.]